MPGDRPADGRVIPVLIARLTANRSACLSACGPSVQVRAGRFLKSANRIQRDAPFGQTRRRAAGRFPVHGGPDPPDGETE